MESERREELQREGKTEESQEVGQMNLYGHHHNHHHQNHPGLRIPRHYPP